MDRNKVSFLESLRHVDILEREGESFRVGALTPYEALVARGDKTKEILLRRSQGNIDKIMADVVREMLEQKLASIHYEAKSDFLLFAPTMGVTLLSAILSIFSTSEVVNEVMKINLTITVACLQLCLSVLQSLSKQLDFSAKAGFHRSASRTLQKIHANSKHAEFEARYQNMYKALKGNKRLSIGMNVLNQTHSFSDSDDDSDDDSHDSAITWSQRNIKYNPEKETLETAKEGKVSDSDLDNTESEKPDDQTPKSSLPRQKRKKRMPTETESIARQYKQAVEQVESFVPVKIGNAFNVLRSRIKVINQSLLTNKSNSLVAWEQVLPALYYQLSEEIIESPGWPIIVPNPKKTVEKTLKHFKEALKVDCDNNADLLLDILDRSNDIFDVQKRLAVKREQKKRKTAFLEKQELEYFQQRRENLNPSQTDPYPAETDPLLVV